MRQHNVMVRTKAVMVSLSNHEEKPGRLPILQQENRELYRLFRAIGHELIIGSCPPFLMFYSALSPQHSALVITAKR